MVIFAIEIKVAGADEGMLAQVKHKRRFHMPVAPRITSTVGDDVRPTSSLLRVFTSTSRVGVVFCTPRLLPKLRYNPCLTDSLK